MAAAIRLSQQHSCSLDNLVCEGKQRRWDVKIDGLRSSEVDHQIELCRHLHRKVGRLFALENPTDVNADAAIGIGDDGAIADQARGLEIIARRIACEQRVTSRQRDELPASGEEERTRTDEQ